MMANLLRSEFRKIRSTRMWWGLTLGGAGIVMVYVAVITFTAGNTGAGSNALHSLSDPGSVRLVYGVPFLVGYLMPLVMGILLIGGEYRHRTITPTFLATPKRGRVLAAKTVAAAASGLVIGG